MQALDTGLRLASIGSTYDAVSVDDIGAQSIVTPPLAEPCAIAAHLDARAATINVAIAHYERAAALAGEYWARRVADTVTGRVDVWGWLDCAKFR